MDALDELLLKAIATKDGSGLWFIDDASGSHKAKTMVVAVMTTRGTPVEWQQLQARGLLHVELSEAGWDRGFTRTDFRLTDSGRRHLEMLLLRENAKVLARIRRDFDLQTYWANYAEAAMLSASIQFEVSAALKEFIR